MLGGEPYNGAFIELPQASNATDAIGYGDLVNTTGGLPIRVAATPTTSRDGNTPIGVCVGVSYTDPTLNRKVETMSLPAGAYTAGYRDIKIKVADDPDLVFKCQCDGSGALTIVGYNAEVVGFATALNKSGVSATGLDYSTIAAGAGGIAFAFRIVEVLNTDSYQEVLVTFNKGVHAYRNAEGA